MSSKLTRNKGFRTGHWDTFDKPSGNRGFRNGLKRLNGWDKQRGRGPLGLGTVQIPLQGSDRAPDLVSFNGREGRHKRQENLNRLWRRRLIFSNEVRSWYQTDSSRFPPNMPWLNRQGVKHTDPMTWCDGHKKSSLNGQTMQRNLIDEWDFWKRVLYKSLAAFWGKSGEPDFLT